MFNRRAGCLGNPLVRFCEGLGGNRETGAALPTRLGWKLLTMSKTKSSDAKFKTPGYY